MRVLRVHACAQFENLDPWMRMVLGVMEAQLSPEQAKHVSSEEELAATPLWRAKKWAIRALQKNFVAHTRPTAKKKARVWAHEWMDRYALEVLGQVLGHMKARADGEPSTGRIAVYCLRFCSEAVCRKETYGLLKVVALRTRDTTSDTWRRSKQTLHVFCCCC
jgi:hypothetical protein